MQICKFYQDEKVAFYLNLTKNMFSNIKTLFQVDYNKRH